MKTNSVGQSSFGQFRLAGVFVVCRKDTLLDVLTSFTEFLDLLKFIKTWNLTKVGSSNFQPVMFGTDLFRGRKLPRHIKRRAAHDFGSHVP